MREIKFRAWHKISGNMADWELMKKECNRLSFLEEKHCLNNGFEVMQYTGLKDKNGVEIYENDVLEAYPRYLMPLLDKDDDSNKLDIFRVRMPNHFLSPEVYIYEIIGNIMEKPELVKP